MSKKKVNHTKQFKEEAVKLVTEQDYSQAEAARRLGVNAKNLSHWVKEAEKPNSKMPMAKSMQRQSRKNYYNYEKKLSA